MRASTKRRRPAVGGLSPPAFGWCGNQTLVAVRIEPARTRGFPLGSGPGSGSAPVSEGPRGRRFHPLALAETLAAAAAGPGRSGGLPADLGQLVAPFGRPSRAAGVEAVAGAAPGVGVEDGGPPAGPEPPPAAPPSSRPHNWPGATTGASDGGSTSGSRSPARTRPRRRPTARRPPGAEDLAGAREAPVAPRHPPSASRRGDGGRDSLPSSGRARLTGIRVKPARRVPRREAGKPARGRHRRAGPDRGVVRRGEERRGAALRIWRMRS